MLLQMEHTSRRRRLRPGFQEKNIRQYQMLSVPLWRGNHNKSSEKTD